MSNKIVPATYRAIIDDVIASIKGEFDEYGVGEEVLADLQTRWENKVIASHVAEFDAPQPVAPHHYPPHPMHNAQHPSHQHHPGYPSTYMPAPPSQPPQPQHPLVKTEPVDSRYALASNAMSTYSLPPLPGPQLNGAARPPPPAAGASQGGYPPRGAMPSNGAPRPAYPPTQSSGSQPPPPRIPQVDGPSSSESESSSPPPSQSYAPHPSHPSLPQPAQASGSARPGDSEEINSDLDDSDSDAEEEDQEGVNGETDIVFCTYDKVARVKNKWKCVLKDGMIHINGKDYLFAKCNCEFEW